MSTSATPPLTAKPKRIVYPETDGQPMAENTVQFRWITKIEGGLDSEFRHEENVFVAGDLFWYPVEGNPGIRQAADTMVVFGRPKGDRSSYRQWEEGGIAPQVVFEVHSPGNRPAEMIRKFQFYERYGVEEYYVYDPDTNEMSGFLRAGDKLQEIPNLEGWVSPRLGVRFELKSGELEIFGRDGRKFATYLELVEQRDREQREKTAAQREKETAQRQKETAHREKEAAQREKEAAQRETAAAKERAERLAAQLRALGAEPEP